MKDTFAVPHDPAAISGWAESFKERFGVVPIAGGETPGGAAAVAPQQQAPAAPAPPPAQPAAPAQPDAAQQQPQAPQPPAGQQPQGQQVDPAAGGQPVEPTPDWAQKLIEGMDRLAPPAQMDPLAVELGLVPAPAQPFPGQQPVPPAQPGQAAGQPFVGGVPQQQAGQPAGPVAPQPGMPAAGQVPGQDPTEDLVNRLIDDRARGVVDGVLQQQLLPYLQQQEQQRQYQEMQALREDYPQMQDPQFASGVVALARQWARETLGDERFASNPGYLETVLRAKMYGDGQPQQQPQAQQQGQQGAAPQVPIEGGGGANPTPAMSDSTKIAQEIVDAKRGGGLNELWV